MNLPLAQSHFVLISKSDIPIEQQRIVQLLESRVLAEARLQLPHIVDKQVLAQWQKSRVIRLLQAASNPGLLNSQPEWPVDVVGDIETSDLLGDVIRFQTGEFQAAKITWAVNKTRELISQGEKVLIWTWWVNNLHLLKEILAEYNPLLLYGAIKPYEDESDEVGEQSREGNIREFRTRNERPLLIANPSACAEAISLHRECHHAIYVDRTFNCGQFLQSLNRIHRVGLPAGAQTNYWIPTLECAVEHVVDNRLRERQQVMYDFLGDETPIIGIDVSEESPLTDSNEELDRDFRAIIGEINDSHDARTSH